MKKQIFLSVLTLLMCCLSAALAQVGEASSENEIRQVRFAERVVTIELVRALSPQVRSERENCLLSCPETGALELAIGLIGINRSDVSADALVNMLGLRLDGAGSEELSCQILFQGQALLRPLEQFRPKQVAEHCQTTFLELRKRELVNVTDVKIEQVCRSESEIQDAQEKWLKAIKLKVGCEQ